MRLTDDSALAMGIDFLVVHLINHFGLSVGAHLFYLQSFSIARDYLPLGFGVPSRMLFASIRPPLLSLLGLMHLRAPYHRYFAAAYIILKRLPVFSECPSMYIRLPRLSSNLSLFRCRNPWVDLRCSGAL